MLAVHVRRRFSDETFPPNLGTGNLGMGSVFSTAAG